MLFKEQQWKLSIIIPYWLQHHKTEIILTQWFQHFPPDIYRIVWLFSTSHFSETSVPEEKALNIWISAIWIAWIFMSAPRMGNSTSNRELCKVQHYGNAYPKGVSPKPSGHRLIAFRLEKPSKTTDSNHSPSTAKPPLNHVHLYLAVLGEQLDSMVSQEGFPTLRILWSYDHNGIKLPQTTGVSSGCLTGTIYRSYTRRHHSSTIVPWNY